MSLKTFAATFLSALALVGFSLAPTQGAQVLTQHNDNARSGANLSETVLNTSNVNAQTFGRLFSCAVDGNIYAQPLYVPQVAIPGKGTHDVVFVATEHNSVFAFDADAAAAPLWHVKLGPPIANPSSEIGNRYLPNYNLFPEIGITSTPVIDAATKTIYVEALSKEAGRYIHRLHALDIATGREKMGGPVVIAGSAPGTGETSVGGRIAFDPKEHLERPALLLSHGLVYLTYGSQSDTDPYHGWVFAYSAANLHLAGLLNLTPDGHEGGIWQSGQGPAADAQGNVYLASGNGSFGPDPAHLNDYGNTFVKLGLPAGGKLPVLDWFTPFNFGTEDARDDDLGSAGPLLVPGTKLMIGGGKEGKFFVMDRANMGHIHAGGDSQIVQSFQAGNGHIHGSPIFWAGPDTGRAYVWTEEDVCKAFRLSNGKFDPTPASTSTMPVPSGMPGGFMSISANGSKGGTGILWVSHPYQDDALHANVAGILRAFDATDISKELWDSHQNLSRDDVGLFAKFTPVTVADGKVYAPTADGHLQVYGLLASYRGPRSAPPSPTKPTATFARVDAKTQGNWRSLYGAGGYYIVGNAESAPAYADVNPIIPGVTIWAPQLSGGPGSDRFGHFADADLERARGDKRNLLMAFSQNRTAGAWHSNTAEGFTIDVNMAGTKPHQVAMYLLDYDGSGRAERIDIVDPATGAVLSTHAASSFNNGQYLVWSISGHVQIKITRTGGPNAVVSGLFFGP